MGNTAGSSVGQEGGVPPLDDAVKRTKDITVAALKVNPEIITLCHGGPIAMPEDAAYVIERTGIAGFVGASSIERLPVEKPLIEATRAFKKIQLNKNR
jgi:predicted TIM-barrel enzyme